MLGHTQISRVTRSKKQAKLAYDRISRWYDLLAGGFERSHRDAAVLKLGPKEGDVVLEIGYGTGHSLVAMAKLVGNSGAVYGIDLSQGMLDIALARVKAAGLEERVFLKCGDAQELPYETAFFDDVFISFTLELFDTPEIPIVLGECRRVLGASGRICVLAMSKPENPNIATRLYEWLHRKLPQYVDCRPIFVHQSLQDAGFHVLDVTPLSFLGLRGEVALAERSSTTLRPYRSA